MSSFPDSIMPNRTKDESRDVKGNRYIVSAADHNKHDEEIRAIEAFLGARRPLFPYAGFSGQSSITGFSGQCDPGDLVDGRCPGEPRECASSLQDVITVLGNVADQINMIKSESVLTTSGIVTIKDPSIPAADGKIMWPTNWPVTTLAQDIADASLTDEEELDELEYVELADVTGMPDGGFVSIINDASMLEFTGAADKLRAAGFTSLATSASPIYSQSDVAMADDADAKVRSLSLGTNVEIMEYTSVDSVNNRILGVKRKKLGTTSTRHAASDLVFIGRLSINCYPVNYKLSDTAIDQVDCVLRSDGKIDLRVRSRTRSGDVFDDDDTVIAYAQYHAVLLKELQPLSIFTAGNFGNCIE